MLAPDPGSLLDRRLGNYRLHRVLGVGGMGVVYAATHEALGHEVAIKVLYGPYACREDVRARFRKEGQTANIVQHGGLAKIIDLSQTPEGNDYIVMEFLNGESLRQRIATGACLGRDALWIGRQLACTLAALHQRGIIHRDLKPDNIMLIADDEIPEGQRTKLIDFGIAKVSSDAGSTRTGAMMGTLAYMAPEQAIDAAHVTDRADVYALGIILYEMLIGRCPFGSHLGMGEIVALHLYTAPEPLRTLNPSISAEVAVLVEAMLAKRASERPSMSEVAQRLAQLSQATPWTGVPSLPPHRAPQRLPGERRSTLGDVAGQALRTGLYQVTARRKVAAVLLLTTLVTGTVKMGLAGRRQRAGVLAVVRSAPAVVAARPEAFKRRTAGQGPRPEQGEAATWVWAERPEISTTVPSPRLASARKLVTRAGPPIPPLRLSDALDPPAAMGGLSSRAPQRSVSPKSGLPAAPRGSSETTAAPPASADHDGKELLDAGLWD